VAPAAEPKSVQAGFVAGTVPVDKLAPFERLLFRATRGNVFLRAAPVGAVADPATGERQEKAVYVVFYAGERAKQKILKICEAFGANRYPFPEAVPRQRQMAAEVNARLRELHSTLDAGARLREGVLRGAAAELEAWTARVRREKGVYHTLNKLSVDVTRKVLMGEAWVPAAGRARVGEALRAAAAAANSAVGTVFQPVLTYEPPPTFFRTNKVTSAFQEIVDAYGIARYREVNPAVFTVVTFPFLFAVMFGDVGHGLLMLGFAAWLVAGEKAMAKRELGDIMGMLFGGRYIILLMACFSIYTGLIYNEFFSIVMTAFGPSRFACATDAAVTSPDAMRMDPSLCPTAATLGLAMPRPGQPYPFGVDPAWHGTRTELPYLNSLKMKMSIVMGVAQMNVGIVLSYLNQRYFADALSTACEFVPQLIFLNALFGYLSVLIALKWATGSTADLYHTLIYMFLRPGDVDCGGACPENRMFAGQAGLQVLLVLVAAACVPWMLLPKPLILKRRAQERLQSRVRPAARCPLPLPLGCPRPSSFRLRRDVALCVPCICAALAAGCLTPAPTPPRAVLRPPGPRRRRVVAGRRRRVGGRHAHLGARPRPPARRLLRGRGAHGRARRGARRRRGVRFWRGHGPPGHPHDRVCAGRGLQHRLLPAPLGALPGALPALRRLLRPRPHGGRPVGEPRGHRGGLWRVCVRHAGRADGHGVAVGFPARAAPALGGVPGQVLPRRRLPLRALLVRGGRRGGGGDVSRRRRAAGFAACAFAPVTLSSVQPTNMDMIGAA
jgi:vacuolar-type H+-ATPase subunit I/STV1